VCTSNDTNTCVRSMTSPLPQLQAIAQRSFRHQHCFHFDTNTSAKHKRDALQYHYHRPLSFLHTAMEPRPEPILLGVAPKRAKIFATDDQVPCLTSTIQTRWARFQKGERLKRYTDDPNQCWIRPPNGQRLKRYTSYPNQSGYSKNPASNSCDDKHDHNDDFPINPDVSSVEEESGSEKSIDPNMDEEYDSDATVPIVPNTVVKVEDEEYDSDKTVVLGEEYDSDKTVALDASKGSHCSCGSEGEYLCVKHRREVSYFTSRSYGPPGVEYDTDP
jgi:hypothetical protein